MSCTKNMTFEECELEILRNAVDSAEKTEGAKLVSDPEIQQIIKTVEEFIRKRKLVCYGGTAINNLLPESDKFYDLNIELPDYDVYSQNAMKDAKDLADIYAKQGFIEVEAKSGMHHGTYKVYVNYLPVADITQVDKEIFKKMQEKTKSVAGIKYAPINFLRMNMYKELSRPKGDISRWEKVLKRLVLFNKNYPLRGHECRGEDIQRVFEESTDMTKDDIRKLYFITRDSFMNQGVVFFGSYAGSLYLRKMRRRDRVHTRQIPDFDVLSTDPEVTAEILTERLEEEGFKNAKILKHDGAGEIIGSHLEVRVGDETIAFIYKPIDCHSYNEIKRDGKVIKVATIDTMLNLYLAFLYADREYYDENRVFCMAEYMFKVQQQNRLSQKGILKRFSVDCYGKPHTIQDILKERQDKFKELRPKRGTKEYDAWFLRYRPGDKNAEKQEKKHSKQRKTKKQKRRSKRTSTRKRLLKLVGL